MAASARSRSWPGPTMRSITASSAGARKSKGELRAAGPLAKDKPIVAFGGNANMPMTITFQVDQYLPSAIEKPIYEPIVLPKGQMGNGIAACRAEMTVDGQTKEMWLSRSESLDPPPPQTVRFRDSVYQVVYDVDRKPLGFELKLDDFDTGFEPGTEQATHFESKVRLTDKSAGIKDQPHTIWMNHPLDHRGYTFYQSNYIRVRDPHTRQFTGQFQSVFQVATNPGRPIIYGGCFLVVLGAFLQFYMRAGIFTDGGKRERERAAIAAKKKAELGMKIGRTLTSLVLHREGEAPSEPPCDPARTGASPSLESRKLDCGTSSGRPEHETNRQATGWVGTGRDVGGRPPRARSRRRQVAGGRPGLRADRQGGRDARRAGQAARHRGPRGGQADLRPRDDQAARPGEEIEKILDPESHARKAAAGSTVEKWGPVGAFVGWTVNPEFWDDQPFILVEYLPLRRRIVAETLATRLKAIADKSTTPDDEKAALQKLAADPEPTATGAHVLPPRLEAAARRQEDHRRGGRQAERGTQVAHPARARRGQDHRQGSRPSVHRMGQRASGAETAVRRQSAVGPPAHRDRAAGDRGRHAALHLQGL